MASRIVAVRRRGGMSSHAAHLSSRCMAPSPQWVSPRRREARRQRGSGGCVEEHAQARETAKIESNPSGIEAQGLQKRLSRNILERDKPRHGEGQRRRAQLVGRCDLQAITCE